MTEPNTGTQKESWRSVLLILVLGAIVFGINGLFDSDEVSPEAASTPSPTVSETLTPTPTETDEADDEPSEERTEETETPTPSPPPLAHGNQRDAQPLTHTR